MPRTIDWKDLSDATGLSRISAKRVFALLVKAGLITIKRVNKTSVTISLREKGGRQ